MKVKLLIIILILLGLSLAVFFYFNNVKSVHDFDSCEKAGYSIRLLNCIGCPKFCDTPWGNSYSKKQ
ncbi:MAG: hypothetical protein NTW73_00395 [Candidatus Parcubacteria bacterium]|nr:hypothetical protein [Candidatus Parcubacteria bacterium]